MMSHSELPFRFNYEFPKQVPQRLAVKLTATGERNVLQHHPWLFSKSIRNINKEGRTGDIAIIFRKRDNSIMGIGLYDAESPIRIKMLHFGGGTPIDTQFFVEKITKAHKKRRNLLKTNTNSYRLLFGENDQFPGLIADVYADVLVVKLYSAIWMPYLKDILTHLILTTQCSSCVIRLSRKLQQTASGHLNDGMVIYGDLSSETIQFVEHGVQFSANVIKGHKTGYFLDHRHNRKQVGEWSRNKTVLDVFAYAGGFSVHALANGAREVTSVDISEQALELAKQNAQLNTYEGMHHTLVGDAFDILQALIEDNLTFDVVVIDPPSFAKQQSEIELAKKKYKQLAVLGHQLTASNGLLVLASCSSRVTADDFFDINASVLDHSGRGYKTILKTLHDEDHPVSFPEGAYLKCAYYRFLDASN